MFSRFFIDRPIFAAVLSIVITLAGAISVFTLPLAQFPSITPPTVQVQCNYPGASARDVAEAVAAPIEQQVNGVEGMMYMSSQCANDGSYNLTVTFQQGIDLNMAQVLVQNRVNLAIPSLPDVIKQTGVTTRKRSPDILMGIALTSPDDRYDHLYLSNFATLQVKDEVSRVRGVGDVFLFGQRDYSMRIWVDTDKMTGRGLTAADVVRAVREQNAQVATGSVGQQPAPAGQEFQITLSTLGRLSEVEQFENVILRAFPDGRVVRIKDVARVELGAKNQDLDVRLDGKEAVFLAIFQMPDANALDTRERVLAKMDDLKQNFPQGISYEIGFDTTPYTSESIREVFKTLRDAIILVAFVVLLFLQNWRSAIIPLVAVPVAIIGTFAAMALFGFSLNNLTLFGLVLAIGIVVDDAIVVVEAVEHHIERGLSPKAATRSAMDQVSGPVIAVGLVLSAVFVPCAFISGITGAFFRQFALTISVSTIISAFNSLTLSPALTAVLLKPLNKEHGPPLPRVVFALMGGWAGGEWLAEPLAHRLPAAPEYAPWLAAALGAALGWLLGRPLNRLLGLIFWRFNRGFVRATGWYTRAVGLALRGTVVVLALYGGLLALTYWQFQRTPRGFIPTQDMGYLMVSVQLPDSASAERTFKVMEKASQIARSIPGVRHATGIGGQSFVLSAAGSNFGSMFLNLMEYADRRDPRLSAESIRAELMRRCAAEIYDGDVAAFAPPPVRGVGRAGGFALMIEDRGDNGPHALEQQTRNLTMKAMMTPTKAPPPAPGMPSMPLMMFSVFRANVPQIHIDPNPRECMAKGVSLKDFADTLQVFEGSLYVNDFNLFGRTWQVIVQAMAKYRDDIDDLRRLTVRNNRGSLVPIGSLANVREVNGPLILPRYNMYPAAPVNGIAPPGMSSGEVMELVQRLADQELPGNMKFEWTDISFLEQKAGNTAMILFACAVAMVFLVLAAQYESWSLPLAVILVVPMCLLCAITGVRWAKMDINIFTQVGFVVLVGLASKNAILIVEFAKKRREAGTPRYEAALEACKLRLRPIVMTSLAFVLGVVPLLTASGAGFEMRRTLGNAVFSGMVGVTAFGLFLTPVFFYTIDRLGGFGLFTSPFVRRMSGAILAVVSLSPLRHRRRNVVTPVRLQEVPAGNGNGNGNGAEAGTQYSVLNTPYAAAPPTAKPLAPAKPPPDS